MEKDNKNIYEDFLGSRAASSSENPYGQGNDEFEGFSSRKDMVFDSFQRYLDNCKVMMLSSLSHLRSPATLIVIMLLIITYILLGVAGNIPFSVYLNKTVQYISTNLDIIVNALLGFFYGPVTCAIGVGLCTIVRMITNGTGFFIGYLIGAVTAGFLHGWILYRLKGMWFGSRWRSFHTDLLAKVFATRFVVSVFVNILLMSVIYKIFIDYPIYEYIMHYSKSDVELTSIYEFLGVFIVSLLVETVIIFIALSVINFIVMKAFPSQFEEPSLIIKEDGTLINLEDEV